MRPRARDERRATEKKSQSKRSSNKKQTAIKQIQRFSSSAPTSHRRIETTQFLFPEVTMKLHTVLILSGVCPVASAVSIFGRHPASLFSHRRFALSKNLRELSLRGGSTRILDSDDNEEEDEVVVLDPEEEKKRLILQKWAMDQQMLIQLRSTFLSEALAKRGIPMTTLADVATFDGDKPPEKVDWDCAMSTNDEPKPCLYSFDAEPNTKVIAPIDTNQWITLSALNRLRRTDPTKVEPMWHSQYAILTSWFGDDSEFSLLQHVGIKGLFITLLLDTARGALLKSVLVVGILSVLIVFMPMLEFIINRALVSGMFWLRWPTWGRFVHAALPLKLLLGQLGWKFLASSFGKLESRVRDYIVDMECAILEESIPLTVGPGSQDETEQIENEEEEDDDNVFMDAVEATMDDESQSNVDESDW